MKLEEKNRIIILLVFNFFLFSCNNKPKTNDSSPAKSADTLSTKDNVANNQQVGPKEKAVDPIKIIKLVCVNYEGGPSSNPRTDVMLSVDGKLTKVKTILGFGEEITKADYVMYEIPKNAVSACGGSLAGAGDYFYVLVNEGRPEVYYGWIDVEGEDIERGYHWKKLNKAEFDY